MGLTNKMLLDATSYQSFVDTVLLSLLVICHTFPYWALKPFIAFQTRIWDPVKHLRYSFYWIFTVHHFHKKIPSYMFDRVANMALHFLPCNSDLKTNICNQLIIKALYASNKCCSLCFKVNTEDITGMSIDIALVSLLSTQSTTFGKFI